MSFSNKIAANFDKHGHVLIKTHKSNEHALIKNIAGDTLNFKTSQLSQIHKQNATSTFTPTGNYQIALQSGAQIDIPVNFANMHGHVSDWWLTMSIQNNTGGNIELTPIYNWFSRIEIRAPNGKVIQQFYDHELWIYPMSIYRSKQWKLWSQLHNFGRNYEFLNDVIPNGASREYVLHVPHSFIQQVSWFAPAVHGECGWRIYFAPPAEVFVSGGAPTISNMQLEFTSPFMLDSDFNVSLSEHRLRPFHYKYLWYNQQSYTQTMNVSTRYEFLLSGFSGLHSSLYFFIRPSSASGQNKFITYPIQDFLILNQEGQDIMGGSNHTDAESRIIEYSRYTDNDFTMHKNIYRYNFSLDQVSDLKGFGLHGCYPLTGRERLQITMLPGIQNKIITFTRIGGAAVASGSFRFVYDGRNTGLQMTPWMAFNETVVGINASLNALQVAQEYQSTFTINQQLTAGANFTITYGGDLQFNKADQNSSLYIETKLLDAAGPPAVAVDYNASITTLPIRGWVNGTYELVISGAQFRTLEVNEAGSITYYDS